MFDRSYILCYSIDNVIKIAVYGDLKGELKWVKYR